MKFSRKTMILGLALVSLLLLAACSPAEQAAASDILTEDEDTDMMAKDDSMMDKDDSMIAKDDMPENADTHGVDMDKMDDMMSDEMMSDDWKSISLTDVRTGEEFTIAQFEGMPVFVESFATWCPNCKKQQGKLADLHDELGDDFISVAISVDPNDDAAKIKAYADDNDFVGYYVVAPPVLTAALVKEFGNSVVNAPSMPIVAVCGDGSASLLERGLKSTTALKGALATCA